MQHTILDTINSPQDIKGLDMEGLRQLLLEIYSDKSSWISSVLKALRSGLGVPRK